jgi:hypothetical protein
VQVPTIGSTYRESFTDAFGGANCGTHRRTHGNTNIIESSDCVGNGNTNSLAYTTAYRQQCWLGFANNRSYSCPVGYTH